MKKIAEGNKKRNLKDKADKWRNLQLKKVSKKKQTLYKKKHHKENESSSEDDLNLDLQNICDDDEMDDIDPLAISDVCLVCGEFVKDGELWYRCISCSRWSHEECSGWNTPKGYKCDLCCMRK
ncbi:uncharacterized protein LOC126413302 [Schistocerca serialis cubense]|uniref:uncharacterized protein LOC126413302 n=1 Tax=Schistocerca serialis cubense TaxID=2023355 RepID=UPI00214ECAB8|nr:uncharacterized protein LOC126413302 [Schistocerca serialis cubense]